jgi:osmotically-inducible protein OsmY
MKGLMRRADIDSSDVSVAVHGGEVLVGGSVPQRGMRSVIEDLAGVRK